MPEDLLETRTVTASFEMREESDGPTLHGYAATFNQAYDLGSFKEQIDPGAFSRTLGTKPDVRLLIDHEGQPLARTKSGTLKLSTDGQGLQVRATLDPTDPDVQRLLPKMRRGDLDQMSFAFRVPKGGDSWENDFSLRTLRNIELNGGDVSVVTYPANPNTVAAVRALDELEARMVFAEVMFAEHRAGKTISAANAAKLQKAMDAMATAHGHIAGVMSGANDSDEPDADDGTDDGTTNDGGQANSGRPLGLALAVAQSLGIAGSRR
jgi:HK97 family phage prohead protease